MVTTQQAKVIDRFRLFLADRFTAPKNSLQIEKDAKELLDHPLFKDYIFSNSSMAIVDHSISGYRYFSESVKDILGVPASVFMEKGLSFAFSMVHPEDAQVIVPALEKAASITQLLPPEHRMHVRFNFSLRYNTTLGTKMVFQQSLPLALNEAGLPYLLLGLISDITPYGKEKGTNYRLTLNLPNQPPKVLLSDNSDSPLTEREKDIVLHLADGFDANTIAEKLSISEGTVRTHRKNILEKTGARNSVHLVRMAMANGWV